MNYERLPVIGNIYQYEHDGTDITSMVIHINFGKFDRSSKFTYPASGLYDYDAIPDPETIEIRHGLFTNSLILPHTDLTMLGSLSDGDIDGEIVRVWPGYNSLRAESKTSVTIASDTAFFGKIVGEISYIL